MPKSVLMLDDAENPNRADKLYLIQGSGVDRDRKVTLDALLSGMDDGTGNDAAIVNLSLPNGITPDHKDWLILGRGLAAPSRKGLMATVEDVVAAGWPEAAAGYTRFDRATTKDEIYNPFNLISTSYNTPAPDPEEPYGRGMTLRHLAEAVGAPLRFNVTEAHTSGDPLDLDPAGSYGEGGWNGELQFIIQPSVGTPSGSDIFIYTTGALPPNSVVSILSNGAGNDRTSTDHVVLVLGGANYTVFKDELLLLFTGDSGVVLAQRSLPKHNSVGSAEIQDDAVTAAHIADDAVGYNNLDAYLKHRMLYASEILEFHLSYQHTQSNPTAGESFWPVLGAVLAKSSDLNGDPVMVMLGGITAKCNFRMTFQNTLAAITARLKITISDSGNMGSVTDTYYTNDFTIPVAVSAGIINTELTVSTGGSISENAAVWAELQFQSTATTSFKAYNATMRLLLR